VLYIDLFQFLWCLKYYSLILYIAIHILINLILIYVYCGALCAKSSKECSHVAARHIAVGLTNSGGPGYSNHTIVSHGVLCRMMPKLLSISRNITKDSKSEKA
jgi:hypothetical protein